MQRRTQCFPATRTDPIGGSGAEKLNTCFLALDAHVEEGRGDAVALIYDSPVTGTIRKYTYRELLDETACFAGVLARFGVTKGDTVLIYMPMIPEAVIAMLACARIGAVRDNGGHAVAMRLSMSAVYDMRQGEVFWAASDVGWVVGHSYIVYGPLLHGCTTILYGGHVMECMGGFAFAHCKELTSKDRERLPGWNGDCRGIYDYVFNQKLAGRWAELNFRVKYPATLSEADFRAALRKAPDSTGPAGSSSE